MTTVKLSEGDLGSESMLIRCNLTNASSPVQVNYGDGNGFVSTQYQCADAKHRTKGLIEIGKRTAAIACEVLESKFSCDTEEV
jgi:uncharacterized protein YraI